MENWTQKIEKAKTPIWIFQFFSQENRTKKKLKTKKEIKSHKPSDTYNIRGIQILQIGKKIFIWIKHYFIYIWKQILS